MTTTAATHVPAAPAPADVEQEVRRLRRWSYRVLAALVAAAMGSAAGIALVLPGHPVGAGSSRLLALALLGGTLGSAASALRSTCERLARGFELDDGGRL